MGGLSGRTVVAMVQPAQSRLADHRTGRRRADSPARGLLAQPKMSSVVMIVGDVRGEKSLPMVRIYGDDVIQQVSPTTSYPALRDSVLPRAVQGGSDGSDVHGSNRRRNFEPILCIMIEDENLGIDS